MTFDNVKNALLSVSSNVYHLTAISNPPLSYIVWAEDTESGSLHGDGKKISQTMQGTVDLYSKIENDPLIDLIQKAFNDYGVGFKLNSNQYEPDTKLIHTEWVWAITGSVG